MITKKIVRDILSTTFVLTILSTLTACDNSFIYDDEGDCSVKVRFEYSRNRQALQTLDGVGVDAFANTVESVHLFVIDEETGNVAFEKTELASNLWGRNMMSVPVPNGTYTFIAWCGLDSNDENNAFELKHIYSSRAEANHCKVKRLSDGNPIHNEKYQALYHGITRHVNITDETIDDIVVVSLTKNTNDIAVWIQHPEADFKAGDYTVSYEDANGVMHFEDNSMLEEENTLTYRPHTTSILTTSSEYNGDEMEAGAMIAHISVARLMASHKDRARLVVRDIDGNEVFAIPFLKYLLQMQTFTDSAPRNTIKDEQWYLDCEDTYNCSFYIAGDQGLWIANRIIVNNWVWVPEQNEEI